jgi:hypothetical protein
LIPFAPAPQKRICRSIPGIVLLLSDAAMACLFISMLITPDVVGSSDVASYHPSKVRHGPGRPNGNAWWVFSVGSVAIATTNEGKNELSTKAVKGSYADLGHRSTFIASL